MQSAAAELAFYQGKLAQLATETAALPEARAKSTRIKIPSYSVYPEFLAHLRQLIAAHPSAEAPWASALGHCQFELGHIRDRIDRARSVADSRETLSHWEWAAIGGLAAGNIEAFATAARLLKAAAEQVSADPGQRQLPASPRAPVEPTQ